jgi:hypothetical protein
MVMNHAGLEEGTHEELVQFAIEVFHRTLIHYGMWFREWERQLPDRDITSADGAVFPSILAVHMKRLGKLLGFSVDKDGIPTALRALTREQLMELTHAQALNWLATDGIWFQQIENTYGMDAAKSINDTCWSQFAPFEARRIKEMLKLGDHSGIQGLKKALSWRCYALVNKQSIHDVDEKSFVFQMNECRVQVTRQSKGLPDYPCHSAGITEFPYFARCIDSRIRTECVGCPPGEHPAEWFCAWKFILED